MRHDLDQLMTTWASEAEGVWSIALGDVEREPRMQPLAAAPPRFDAISKLPSGAFPWADDACPSFQCDDLSRWCVRLPTQPDEQIYGLGLQLDGLRRSGQVVKLQVDHWSRGGGRTHAPVPFYISSKGYGVWFDTSRVVTAHVQISNRQGAPNNPLPVDRNPPAGAQEAQPWTAQPRAHAVEASIVGHGLRIVVFTGETLLDVVRRYNLYNGGGSLPPLWGLGFWHRLHASASASDALAEVDEFRQRRIPIDVLGLEPGWMSASYPCSLAWQTKRFPDPSAHLQQLRENGVRVNLWINPLHGTVCPIC